MSDISRNQLTIALIQIGRLVNSNIWPFLILLSNDSSEVIMFGLGLAIANPLYIYLMYTSDWKSPNPMVDPEIKLNNFFKKFSIVQLCFDCNAFASFFAYEFFVIQMLLVSKLLQSSLYLFLNISIDTRRSQKVWYVVALNLTISISVVLLYVLHICDIFEAVMLHVCLCCVLNLIYKNMWQLVFLTAKKIFCTSIMLSWNIVAFSALLFSSVLPMQRLVGLSYLSELDLVLFIKLQLLVSFGIIIVNFTLPFAIRLYSKSKHQSDGLLKMVKNLSILMLVSVLLVSSYGITNEQISSPIFLWSVCLLSAVIRSMGRIYATYAFHCTHKL